ncbi:helix-turn-helix transcriptional regulator [Photobacterium indicum]|uniref:helix-turn-helix transcriptional regulator n=1 Tax=Photobacterium indicum TaxID=81447 RepID=UPI003D140D48
MKTLIRINTFHAIKPQPLRNVPIYTPSIIAVQSGRKVLKWHDDALTFNKTNWLVIPASQQLTFINEPHQTHFNSTQISFLSPPSETIMSALDNHNDKKIHSPPHIGKPLIATDAALDFVFSQLVAIVKQKLSIEVQRHYLNAFYQQLLEIGVLHLLFPASTLSMREKVSRYLSANPADHHSIEATCRHFSTSKATLTRHLAKEDTLFRDVLAEVRMLHGLSLMQQFSYTQLELALRCGYQSEARFSQRFQQQFGITPKQYMKTVMKTATKNTA